MGWAVPDQCLVKKIILPRFPGFGFGDYRNGCKPTKRVGLYNVPNNSPVGMKRCPSPSPNRVKTNGDAGFGAPLPS